MTRQNRLSRTPTLRLFSCSSLWYVPAFGEQQPITNPALSIASFPRVILCSNTHSEMKIDDIEPLLVTNLRHFGVGDTTGHIPRSQRLVSWHAGSVMTWCSFARTQGSLKMHLEMSENDSGGNLTNLTLQCLYLLEMRCFAINFLNGISVLSLRFDLNLWQKDLKSGVSSVLKRVWAGKHPLSLLLCSEFGLCFMCFMCLDKSRLGSRKNWAGAFFHTCRASATIVSKESFVLIFLGLSFPQQDDDWLAHYS
jgi:hypothetical protein